jgi:hypothetical protein
MFSLPGLLTITELRCSHCAGSLGVPGTSWGRRAITSEGRRLYEIHIAQQSLFNVRARDRQDLWGKSGKINSDEKCVNNFSRR